MAAAAVVEVAPSSVVAAATRPASRLLDLVVADSTASGSTAETRPSRTTTLDSSGRHSLRIVAIQAFLPSG